VGFVALFFSAERRRQAVANPSKLMARDNGANGLLAVHDQQSLQICALHLLAF